ncbi:MAG: hypothetical protein AABW51_04755 [Nanoarchaeota archaeon]|mgnify:CR=1 FL=1
MKDLSQNILKGLWFYDTLLEDITNEMYLSEEAFSKAKKAYKECVSKFRLSNKSLDDFLIQDLSLERITFRDFIKLFEDQKATSEYHLLKRRSWVSGIRNATTILMGPATIDSLIDESPRTYEYIKEGRLPFNNLFFNLLEPYKIKVPFENKESEIFGIWFYRRGEIDESYVKTEESKEYGYRLIAFSKEYEQVSSPLELILNPESMGKFFGQINDYSFLIDTNQGTVDFTKWSNNWKGIETNEYERRIKLTNMLNSQEFFNIANLSTNIINYINAHNVTFIKKERKVKVPTKFQTVKKKASSKPFYLVTVKDEIVETEPDPTKSWELQWKVYVRGHDRRYRDEQGEITKIIWIAPYVKGPPEAPWKENRYAVSAEKLLRERELNKHFEIN